MTRLQKTKPYSTKILQQEITNCPKKHNKGATNRPSRDPFTGVDPCWRTLTYDRPLISGLKWSHSYAGAVPLECYTPEKDDSYFPNLRDHHKLEFASTDTDDFGLVKPGDSPTASLEDAHTRWISEEHGGARPHETQCPENAWAVQVGCYNSQCVRLTCATYVGISWGDCRWTDYAYSEEAGLISFKDSKEFLTGINCSGRYCDNIHYRVCKLTGYTLD